MSETLKVNVVTPTGALVIAEETDAVTAPGELGEFEVLPGHVPFLTSLHPGVLTLGENRPQQVYAVSRGYLRVAGSGEVEILVEKAVSADKIDKDGATAVCTETGDELDAWKEKPQDAAWKNLKARHDWAQAQLDARDAHDAANRN